VTRFEDLMRAVTDDPESDDARLAFAAYIRDSDAERATLIEEQVAQAARRRAHRWPLDSGPHPLVEKRADWHRTLAKYTSRLRYDRGFVAEIKIEPYLFLEEGKWLFINAPIRVVELSAPQGGPFPAAELADSPLLAHLDALHLDVPDLTVSDVERLAQSPHLGRLLVLESRTVPLPVATYETLAANPATRKMLRMSFSSPHFPGDDYGPTGQVDRELNDIWGKLPMKAEGEAIEQRHGYVPWLHPSDNRSESLDAAWYVAHGVLPARPVGSR
jgi:uncharacterized protein (TIGR02996 family)